MTVHPATIRDDAPVSEAQQRLHELDVRHLPVIDESGSLVGMLSDRDLRSASPGRSVIEVMTNDVLSVDLEADIAEIIDLMLDHRIGAVPVVDGDGMLAGIVSYVDILRAIEIEASPVV
jgi:acetoin utilization protein AcuB